MSSDLPSSSHWRRLRGGVARRLFGGKAGNIFRGMATLTLGSGTARLLGLASIPFLTRIYAPEDFGALSVFAAFLQIAVPFATLRYLVALPLPRRDSTAFALFVLCSGLACGLSLLAGLMLLLFGGQLLRLLSMEILAPYWWLLVLGTLGASLYELLNMWATRKQAYGIIARTHFVQSAIGEGLKIALGLIGIKPLGLLLGQAAGQSGGVTHLTARFIADFRQLASRLTYRQVALAAWRYRGFPAYRLPAHLLLVLSMQVPVLAVAYLYDAGTTGQFGLATMALALPMSIFGAAIGKAYYGEISRISHDRESILKISRVTILALFSISIPFSAFLFFLSPYFINFLFGYEWKLAGLIISYMSLQITPQLMASSISESFNIFKSQKPLLLLLTVRLFLSCTPFYASFKFSLSFDNTILILSIMNMVYYFIMTAVALRLIRRAA